ncbi:hypothetical protein BLOT_016019 [Blomia tropicalis]|nr:hypothetical protein BLOT_016019 [Blomia tropicalis]
MASNGIDCTDFDDDIGCERKYCGRFSTLTISSWVTIVCLLKSIINIGCGDESLCFKLFNEIPELCGRLGLCRPYDGFRDGPPLEKH